MFATYTSHLPTILQSLPTFVLQLLTPLPVNCIQSTHEAPVIGIKNIHCNAKLILMLKKDCIQQDLKVSQNNTDALSQSGSTLTTEVPCYQTRQPKHLLFSSSMPDLGQFCLTSILAEIKS